MARINLSIPDDLKTRMDAHGAEVNWSEVATAAFEDKLREHSATTDAHLAGEIAAALRKAPGLAVEALAQIVGAQAPHLGHAFSRGLRPVIDRLAQVSPPAKRGPEAAIDDLRATLGAEVILLRLELLERRERRRERRDARRKRPDA